LLAAARAADMPGLLAAGEIAAWQQRTPHWFSETLPEPGIQPAYFSLATVSAFIDDTAAAWPRIGPLVGPATALDGRRPLRCGHNGILWPHHPPAGRNVLEWAISRSTAPRKNDQRRHPLLSLIMLLQTQRRWRPPSWPRSSMSLSAPYCAISV
jgi:hypothetical protein